jgi:diadenosine tetraphosphate (Ap4A) HIT family hydrolase
MQYLAGYCILQADPAVSSLNDLLPQARADFLTDMARVGDALLHVTGAYRINYAIMGNSDPTLHAHIVPRYLDEAEALRKGHPWIYPAETMSSILFDASRDQDLIRKIAAALYTV